MIKYMKVSSLFSKVVEFEWDDGNLEHIRKHRFNYKECEQVFYNKPILVSQDKKHSQVESRFRVLGKTKQERLTILVFTTRWGKVRIISTRDQSKKERSIYQKMGVNKDG